MPVPTTTWPLNFCPSRLNADGFSSTTTTSWPSASSSLASAEPTRPHPTMRYLMSGLGFGGRRTEPSRESEAGFLGAWLSLVERFVRDEEVARSNRVAPTNPPLSPVPGAGDSDFSYIFTP